MAGAPPSRILFATVGSLGDLFPFLAVGRALAARGHAVTVASHAVHAPHVAAAGLDFVAAGTLSAEAAAGHVEHAFAPLRGPRFLVDLVARDAGPAYAAIEPVAREAALIATSSLAFAGQVAAERWARPWMSAVLSPMVFLSAHQFPPLGPFTPLHRGTHPARAQGHMLRWLAQHGTAGWTRPLRRLRARLGLPVRNPRGNPLFDAQHGPDGVLALFPEAFAPPQPDWPPGTDCTGFALYDSDLPMPDAVRGFLAAGPPPLVFTLGSAAVAVAGRFFHESVRAARAVGRRALLVGAGAHAAVPAGADDLMAVDAVPYERVFPHAAVLVHQGGIGTCARALQAARPMLVVPHGFDQPDNAARLTALGVARALPARRYGAERAAAELRSLLREPGFAKRARRGAAMTAPDGATAAADRIEATLRRNAGAGSAGEAVASTSAARRQPDSGGSAGPPRHHG
ncbi:glycosyltransferase [Coralloluteibacterium stylophorae]|uniref:Glycosyltransferase family 1 protein n=1 Tax=Coralloluteibacterium stylophorae TaxID=1776034 RepID=A0A8J7VU92_9GAMM|nr:glycosyltransferase [Coralloluteibacterium stylophorae]MBS7455594.1 glycosyltransferase family 1 protein [Coralloluteibacterium stylophorae]